MKKEGDKRVNNDSFKQVEKCYTCGKLFWARSEFELGNWERNCAKCKNADKEKELKRQKRIKKLGKEIRGENGILGWKLGKEELINYEYQFPGKYKDISSSNIDDIIRDAKREYKSEINKITIKWGAIPFEILLNFVIFCGFGNIFTKKFKYIGVTHIRDIKIDGYKIISGNKINML